MNNVNLLIATSPMQVVNGIEAIKHFSLTETILVLTFKRGSKHQKNNDQLEEIAKLHNWKQVIRMNSSPKTSKFMENLGLITKLKKMHFNYVFVGYLTKTNRVILSNLNSNNLYLIDDGTATINVYKNTLLKNKINKFAFKNLKFLLCGLRINIKKQINLFTSFNLKQEDEREIITNNYSHCKLMLANTANYEDIAIFLGQPLIDKNEINSSDYIHYIKEIITRQDSKLRYIPHRSEKVNSELKQLVSEKFEIVEIDLPIELYFIRNNFLPKKVIGFCTSATFTLDKIFPDSTLEHIVIPEQKLLKRRAEFKEFYRSLSAETSSKALSI